MSAEGTLPAVMSRQIHGGQAAGIERLQGPTVAEFIPVTEEQENKFILPEAELSKLVLHNVNPINRDTETLSTGTSCEAAVLNPELSDSSSHLKDPSPLESSSVLQVSQVPGRDETGPTAPRLPGYDMENRNSDGVVPSALAPSEMIPSNNVQGIMTEIGPADGDSTSHNLGRHPFQHLSEVPKSDIGFKNVDQLQVKEEFEEDEWKDELEVGEYKEDAVQHEGRNGEISDEGLAMPIESPPSELIASGATVSRGIGEITPGEGSAEPNLAAPLEASSTQVPLTAGGSQGPRRGARRRTWAGPDKIGGQQAAALEAGRDHRRRSLDYAHLNENKARIEEEERAFREQQEKQEQLEAQHQSRTGVEASQPPQILNPVNTSAVSNPGSNSEGAPTRGASVQQAEIAQEATGVLDAKKKKSFIMKLSFRRGS